MIEVKGEVRLALSPKSPPERRDPVSFADDFVTGYQKLHDGLSDMVEDGRLTEADIPDDYEWLTDSLENLAGAKPPPDVTREYMVLRLALRHALSAVFYDRGLPQIDVVDVFRQIEAGASLRDAQSALEAVFLAAASKVRAEGYEDADASMRVRYCASCGAGHDR